MGVILNRKPFANSFLSVRNIIGVTLNRKLYANSFLSARSTVEPRRTGNHTQKVSCRHAYHWYDVVQETFSYIFVLSFFSHQEKKKVRMMATVQ